MPLLSGSAVTTGLIGVGGAKHFKSAGSLAQKMTQSGQHWGEINEIL
ncbi:hypothetical protein [Photorhabdus heterorhabditis]|nr:hypothetical protein [Photorhabdus heterorhabditis]